MKLILIKIKIWSFNLEDHFDLNNNIKKPESKVMAIEIRIDTNNLNDQNKENNFFSRSNNNKQAMKPIEKENYSLVPKYDKGY